MRSAEKQTLHCNQSCYTNQLIPARWAFSLFFFFPPAFDKFTSCTLMQVNGYFQGVNDHLIFGA